LNFIISEVSDNTTDLVMEWLLSSNINIKRLNHEEVVTDFNYRISNANEDEVLIENKSLSKIWHRRGKIKMTSKEKVNDSSIHNYIKRETDSVVKSLELNLKDNIDYVGSYIKETENYKLRQLKTAKANGLTIPETFITTSKSQLSSFLKKYPRSITKDLRYPVKINLKDKILGSSGVKEITLEMINNLDRYFSPIMVQECIDKVYEIRLFFFKEKMYPMAIFSQANLKTQIDFRNYDNEKPNRCVPVLLPDSILIKIKKFIREYGLNSGSIDLIYSKNNEYIFLEVNPQGQLDWLSKECNYYLEKDIADFFTQS